MSDERWVMRYHSLIIQRRHWPNSFGESNQIIQIQVLKSSRRIKNHNCNVYIAYNIYFQLKLGAENWSYGPHGI